MNKGSDSRKWKTLVWTEVTFACNDILFRRRIKSTSIDPKQSFTGRHWTEKSEGLLLLHLNCQHFYPFHFLCGKKKKGGGKGKKSLKKSSEVTEQRWTVTGTPAESGWTQSDANPHHSTWRALGSIRFKACPSSLLLDTHGCTFGSHHCRQSWDPATSSSPF